MIPTVAHIIADNGRLIVSGQLNFATIKKLWKASLPLLASQTELHFDLSKVLSSNSAGIALLIEWMKYAKQHQKTITFERIPAQLQSIAAVSGVTSILTAPHVVMPACS
jgi:phospholipid transport system transporter-binding protein